MYYVYINIPPPPLVAATYFSINIITVARQKAEKQAKAKLSNASKIGNPPNKNWKNPQKI